MVSGELAGLQIAPLPKPSGLISLVAGLALLRVLVLERRWRAGDPKEKMMNHFWQRSFVRALMLVTLVSICGGAANAQKDEPGNITWIANFAIGAAQSAELMLDNTSCAAAVLVSVATTDSQGSTTRDAVAIQGGGIWIYDVTAPVGSDDRRRFGVEVQAEPGPCSSRLEAALAIIDDVDGSTAAVLRAPSHAGPIDDTNDSTAAGLSINRIDVPATRIGWSQTAEFGFWNRCPEDISVELRLSNTGEEEEEIFTLDVGASDFGQLIVAVPGHQDSVAIRGFGTFEVKHRDAKTDTCPPGHGLFTVNLSIVDEQGNADQASGLPTGKRQHKPVNVTRSD